MRRSSNRRSSRRAASLLTPNAPIDRLKYIVKTYGEKQPWVVLDTLSVIFDTIGIDNASFALKEEAQRHGNRTVWSMFGYDGKLHGGIVYGGVELGSPYQRQLHYWWFGDPEIEKTPDVPMLNERLSLVLELVDSPTFADGAMRESSEADGIFPWVARELSKVAKVTIREMEAAALGAEPDVYVYQHYSDYIAALESLRSSGNAIAQWAKANRVDLMKMSLVEVLSAIKGFRVKKKVEHGEIVYKFKSGWTVESLKGKKQLDCEGDLLSHCVYSYKDAVDKGRSVIYSLRDPDGVPYVTMEWEPRPGDRWDGSFTQVFGHKNATIGSDEFAEYVYAAGQDNDPPLTPEEVPEVVEAIRAMVIEFIDKVKGGELRGIALAGGLSGRDMTGADLSGANLNGADMYRAILRDADLQAAMLHGANLNGADLRGANLRGAFLKRAYLNEANLKKANLSLANMGKADLRGADLAEADLRGADLTEAALYQADLREADLHMANLYRAVLNKANLSGADLTDANLTEAGLSEADLSGARYNQTRWPSGFNPVAAGAVLVTGEG